MKAKSDIRLAWDRVWISAFREARRLISEGLALNPNSLILYLRLAQLEFCAANFFIQRILWRRDCVKQHVPAVNDVNDASSNRPTSSTGSSLEKKHPELHTAEDILDLIVRKHPSCAGAKRKYEGDPTEPRSKRKQKRHSVPIQSISGVLSSEPDLNPDPEKQVNVKKMIKSAGSIVRSQLDTSDAYTLVGILRIWLLS
ncbi:unnamed protein product [Protopolystoma xenopodis]|uniref:Uncharacterized protein n=1 Tax=Protopolystoma xenopodis TaxID=117903 RepID=A0A448WVT4_9PLAT|nr:unnamed protein product [Protopolystoma xenopodis]